jgi:hypothetical protein
MSQEDVSVSVERNYLGHVIDHLVTQLTLLEELRRFEVSSSCAAMGFLDPLERSASSDHEVDHLDALGQVVVEGLVAEDRFKVFDLGGANGVLLRRQHYLLQSVEHIGSWFVETGSVVGS